MPSISIIVVVLLFILLVVFCVLSAKHWHWSNIVFLLLAYISGVSACAGLAQVLDGRSKAIAAEKKSSEELQRYTDQYNLAVYGPEDAPGYSEDSLRGRTAALDLELHGRGRVWTGVATGAGQNKTITFPEPRGATEGDSVSLKDVVMYAFLNEIEPDGTVIPRTFIGTTKVAAETPTAWTLRPEFLVREDLFESDGNSWTIYEKMPADRHDTFLKAFGAVEGEKRDVTAFRQDLETRFFPASALGFEIDSQDDEVARVAQIEYERFIDRIAFDGMSLGEIDLWIESADRVSGDFVPLPNEEFVKYQFTEKSDSSNPFLVDADGNLSSEGVFTRNGQSVDKGLHNGGEIRFDENDIVLVDSKNATGYQRTDQTVLPFNRRYAVKELDRVFIRRLNNFPLMLEKYRIQTKVLAERTAVFNEDIEIAKQINQDAYTQQETRDLIIGQLREDNANLSRDLEIIVELLDNRQREVEALQERIDEVREDIKRRRGQIQ